MDHFVSLGLRQDAIQFHATEQQRPSWCWAACAQMILGCHGILVDQERIVRAVINIDPNVRMDKGAEDRTMSRVLSGSLERNGKKYSIESDYIAGIPPAKTLIGELVKGCPVIVSYQSTPQARHAVLVTWVEYMVRDGKPTIYRIRVMDPWPGHGPIEYDTRQFAQFINAAWTVNVSVYQPLSLSELFG